MCVCVCACVRACVRACVSVIQICDYLYVYLETNSTKVVAYMLFGFFFFFFWGGGGVIVHQKTS